MVLDIGSSVQYNDYVGSDAYFTIENVEVAMGEYLAPEEDEPEDPIVPPVNPDEPDEPEEPGEIEYFNAVEIEASIDDANEITY